MKEIGILGGGVSGLTLGYLLEKPFEVIEKRQQCCGLFERFEKDGFTFDAFGCHIFFSKNAAVKEFVRSLFTKEDILHVKRKNKIYVKNRFVKYPIENGLGGLAKEDIAGCLIDYVNQHISRETGRATGPENFREWLIYRFGKHLAELYLIPYNEKIWKTDSEKISLDWISGIVPQPPLEDVIKSAVGIETEGGIAEQFDALYPRLGGFQAITDRLERKVGDSVVRGFEIRKILKKDGVWHVSDGSTERTYKKIVSTIPLPELIRCMDDVPEEVRRAAESLKFNSLISVMIAANGQPAGEVAGLTAVYSPEKDILFNRVGLMENYSAENVPKGKHALTAEITAKHTDNLWMSSDEKISGSVVESLQKMGLVRSEDILFTRVARTKYAYIIYDFDYRNSMGVIRKFLESSGIITLGRFGQFEYMLGNACMENATKLAEVLNESN